MRPLEFSTVPRSRSGRMYQGSSALLPAGFLLGFAAIAASYLGAVISVRSGLLVLLSFIHQITDGRDKCVATLRVGAELVHRRGSRCHQHGIPSLGDF